MIASLELVDSLEEKLRLAMLGSDVSALDALIADDLVFTTPDGQRVGKEQDLAAHRLGSMKLSRLEQGKRIVQLWADTMVVVVVAELVGQFGGQDFAGAFVYTRIWRCQAGRWQVASGHCAMLPKT